MYQLNTNRQIKETLFDPSLTPQNAKRKGYDYITDVIYDFLNPTVAMITILEFSRKFQCKFGTPSSTALDLYFGLYMPINQIHDNHYKAE